jgi:SAM-dependent methyltransferase
MPGYRQQGLYADPVLYDILYTPGTAAEVDALERIERRQARGRKLKRDRLWLEPACGTGRYLRTAAGRGRRCLGFDLDDRQLDYARRRRQRGAGRPPRYCRADMADFIAPCGLRDGSVDFAFNPVNSIRHLPTDRAMLDHFAQVARVLRPGAVYVVGISLVDYDWLLPEEDLWEGRRGACRVSQLVNYLPPEPGTALARVERAVSHLTVTRPREVRHFDAAYDLRCYDLRQWQALLRRSDLRRIAGCDAFGQALEGRTLPYQLEVLGPR